MTNDVNLMQRFSSGKGGGGREIDSFSRVAALAYFTRKLGKKYTGLQQQQKNAQDSYWTDVLCMGFWG